jgi:very-short-patch-repair endonuclease
MREESAKSERDARVARLGARQHGVVSVTQLIAAGVDRNGVTRRVGAGRLHRIHQGVYAVGHVGLSREGRWMAAVLACGPGAVLSHRAAAALWRMIAYTPQQADVTVPGANGRKRRTGIRLHRSITLLPSHCTIRNAIPVTKPARTLDDLRRVSSAAEYAAALREAEYLRLPIGEQPAADRTRSELERRFLRLCRRHRLPSPEVNVKVGRVAVDFVWRDRRLVVETDGWRAHGGRLAFEEDRARDVDLKLQGYEVLRFTHRQVTQEPSAVASTLRALLRH